MATIQIAPSSNEIVRTGDVFSCEFNSMKIEWKIEQGVFNWSENNETEDKLKDWLCAAIAMSGKIWQVPYLLNKNLPFTSKIFVNNKEVEYPKDI